MANFFLDNKDLQFHLQHPLMRKIVALKERNYTLKDHHELAPQNFEDAMDNYRRVLEIAGEVCGEVIAPNAEGVDHEGPRVENDHVVYAEGTARNIDAITKAGLSGVTLPNDDAGRNSRWSASSSPTKWWHAAMPVSRISGVCRTVPKRSMNSLRKSLSGCSCPVFLRARPARWTLPSRMQVRTWVP